MFKAFVALVLGLVIVWNVQALDGFEKGFVELIISGKIPGTEVYMGLALTGLAMLVAVLFLFRWIRQLFDDFLDFSLEYSKQEQARQAEALNQAALAETQADAETLGDEELDLLSA